MDDEERPSKMRKLDGGHVSTAVGHEDSTLGEAASLNDMNGMATIQDDLDERQDLSAAKVENKNEIKESNPVLGDDRMPQPDEIAPIDVKALFTGTAPPSKNQLKKLRKKQEWESKREERKLIKKEKLTAKRERKREARHQEAAANGEDLSKPLERPKPPPAQRAVTLPVTILIDCDFDDLMRDNERVSLAAQVTRSYSDNKNSLYRAHLAVCSFGGKLRERFDNILSHYKSWRGVRFLDSDFVDAAAEATSWMTNDEDGGKLAGMFAKFADMDETTRTKLQEEAEVVYLSSESNETLTELKPYSTYIIGGLVDKNREKGICYKRATQRGVRTAKLPIGEYLDMSSRKVLTTNHVNEIMLKWLECGDWGQAFLKAIPKRKGGKLRGTEEGADETLEDSEGNDTVPQDQKESPQDLTECVGTDAAIVDGNESLANE